MAHNEAANSSDIVNFAPNGRFLEFPREISFLLEKVADGSTQLNVLFRAKVMPHDSFQFLLAKLTFQSLNLVAPELLEGHVPKGE